LCENALAEAMTTRDFGEVAVFGYVAVFGGLLCLERSWRDEPKRLKMIEESIRVLVEELPVQLEYFSEIARGGQAVTKTVKSLLEAYKKLAASARAARKLGLAS
jgi:hypothetical protein